MGATWNKWRGPTLRGEGAVYAAKVRSCAVELSRVRDRLVTGNIIRFLVEIGCKTRATRPTATTGKVAAARSILRRDSRTRTAIASQWNR